MRATTRRPSPTPFIGRLTLVSPALCLFDVFSCRTMDFKRSNPAGGEHSYDDQSLRSLRNAVIGSRTRKSEIVAQGRVPE